jgi:hypothetical protein
VGFCVDFLFSCFAHLFQSTKQRGKVGGNAATKQGAHKPTWKDINAQKRQ